MNIFGRPVTALRVVRFVVTVGAFFIGFFLASHYGKRLFRHEGQAHGSAKPAPAAWAEIPVNGTIAANTWPSGRGWNRLHAIGNGKFLVQDSMNACGDPFSNSLWEYDVTTNTMTRLWWSGGGAHPNPGTGCPQPQVVVDSTVIFKPGPGDRHPFQQNDFDPVHQVYFQAAGLEDQGNCAGTGKGTCGYMDTWVWDLAAHLWTRLADMPAPKEQAAAAYDLIADELVYFGGTIKGAVDRNTWLFSRPANTWTIIKNSAPPARLYQTMFYDAQRGHIVMYGGELNNGTPLSDMWTFDSATNVWTEVAQSGNLPTPERFPPMAFDSANGLYYLYAGPNATYTFDPDAGVWSLTTIQGGPAFVAFKENSYSMDFDPQTRTLVIKALSPHDSPQVLWSATP